MISSFRFEALTPDGALENGVITAADRESAIRIVRDRNLFPIAVKPVRFRTGATVSQRDLALGLRMLSDLIACGLSASKAILVFEQVAPRSWRATLPLVIQRLREGSALGAGLEHVGIRADLLAIVVAGERGDGLAAGLRRAAEIVEDAAKTRAALLAALSYPILLAIVGGATCFILVEAVLPKFAAMVADLGQSLPPTTQALIFATVTLQRAAPFALGSALLMAVAWMQWTRTTEGRRHWHEAILKAPMVGPIRRAQSVARACAAAAAMLDCGVPLPIAMTHAAAASGDAAIGARLESARARIVNGARISRALEDTGAATETVIQLARIGEESGRLPSMLQQAAHIERDRAVESTRTLVRLIEPALIFAFGGLVALYSIRPGS
jgi:general secretion pathway protein F